MMMMMMNSLQCIVFANIAVSQNQLEIPAKISISIQFDLDHDFDLRFDYHNISSA